MIIDPIADLVVRIKNANKARHPEVTIFTSKMATNLLQLLQDQGYITSFETKKQRKSNVNVTVVKLKYKEQTPVIQGIKQISKPGLRVYQEATKLPRVLNGLGIAIISTSQGLLTDKAARAQHLGGEIVAYV
ncbi:30S ribosomal protein S8 [Bacilli bacterium]|nr:30S ribosomal protein S8 [Bacilli bacterium]